MPRLVPLLKHLFRSAAGDAAAPSSLLEEHVPLSPAVHLKRMPARGGSAKPASVGPLPHPLLDPRADGCEICLIARGGGVDVKKPPGHQQLCGSLHVTF
jgi:hypothetical protein